MKKYEHLYVYVRNLIRAELRGIELTAKSIKRRKVKKDLLLSYRARNLILARAFLLGKNYLQAERKAKISPVPEEISKTIRSYFQNVAMCPTSSLFFDRFLNGIGCVVFAFCDWDFLFFLFISWAFGDFVGLFLLLDELL